MATQPKKSPAPEVPPIYKCPRCGNPILLGDRRCSRCGYNVMTLKDNLREIPPVYFAIAGIVLGVIFVAGAFQVEDTLRVIFLFVAAGLAGGGWTYYILDYILRDPKGRRRRLR